MSRRKGKGRKNGTGNFEAIYPKENKICSKASEMS